MPPSGDATLFMRADPVKFARAVMTAVLRGWQSTSQPPLAREAAASCGPAEADDLLAREAKKWRTPVFHAVG